MRANRNKQKLPESTYFQQATQDSLVLHSRHISIVIIGDETHETVTSYTLQVNIKIDVVGGIIKRRNIE